jgi:hypothetical protein
LKFDSSSTQPRHIVQIDQRLTTEHLQDLGIFFAHGHRFAHLAGCQFVVGEVLFGDADAFEDGFGEGFG